jgi:hypothetical protein
LRSNVMAIFMLFAVLAGIDIALAIEFLRRFYQG